MKQQTFESFFWLVAVAILAIGGYSIMYMLSHPCDGMWVKDAMGMPHCINPGSVNVIVH